MFQINGFDKKRLFYTKGIMDFGNVPRPVIKKTYDNEETVRKMIAKQHNMKIPSKLVPYCPICGAPMTMNLRCDDSFVQDHGWYEASQRYKDFIRKYQNMHILYLELGVGGNTPVIIKYPFWKMTAQNKKAVYACVNLEEIIYPKEIEKQSICINGDICKVLHDLHN